MAERCATLHALVDGTETSSYAPPYDRPEALMKSRLAAFILLCLGLPHALGVDQRSPLDTADSDRSSTRSSRRGARPARRAALLCRPTGAK